MYCEKYCSSSLYALVQEILVAEDISVFSSREPVRRSVISTKGISSVQRDDPWAFDFLEKKSRIDPADRFDAINLLLSEILMS